jgi:hypothetical protein
MSYHSGFAVPILTNTTTKEGEEEAGVSGKIRWNLREEFKTADSCRTRQTRVVERRLGAELTKAKKYHINTSDGVTSVRRSALCCMVSTIGIRVHRWLGNKLTDSCTNQNQL